MRVLWMKNCWVAGPGFLNLAPTLYRVARTVVYFMVVRVPIYCKC